jgi:hypothetical protein
LNGSGGGPWPGTQLTLTARLFTVERHGSPKVPFVAGTVHVDRPAHSDSTAEIEVVAPQLPTEKFGHEPDAVP